MSYNSAEISNEDGRPIALYTLEWGNTIWRYTSADRDIEYPVGSGNLFLAKAVSDGGMVQGGSSANDFTVDCPADLPIVGLFRGTPPSETIWLTVRRQHFGEPDAPIYWTGTVNNVKRLSLSSAQIIGKPLTASFKRTGLRLCWTRECPHFLYDAGCKVNPEAYRVNVVIDSMTGNTITLEDDGSKPEGYFTGGFIAWEINDDGTIERRMIEKHAGNVLTVFGITDGLEVGLTVACYPGCDRRPITCKDKFNNNPNYGGFDFMPGETPFGTLIF
jgi:uncharacterized phage protein (TIGR02218 family)